MDGHLHLLRAFYRREFVGSRRDPRTWSFDLTLEWLALMRIGPFRRVYLVQHRGAGCPRCASQESRGAPAAWVEVAWPGGAKLRCNTCGQVWLQIDGKA
jgi:hypothetical protein